MLHKMSSIQTTETAMQRLSDSSSKPSELQRSCRFFRRFLERLPYDERPGSPLWRQRLFYCVFLSAVILGILAYVPNMVLALQSGRWILAAAFTGIYAAGIGLAVAGGVPYRPRAWAGLALFFIMGVLSLGTTGLAGSGRIWLIGCTMMASLFLGFRAGLTVMAMNLVVFFLLTISLSQGRLNWLLPAEDSFHIWIVSGLSFVFMNTVVAAAMGFFTERLDLMLSKEQALVAELTQANTNLEAENRERRQAEQKLTRSEANLRAMTLDLEQRVAERTQALESANQQLRQVQKMEAIGTLAGGIAHDFNNLLMAIQGYASLMLYGMSAENPHVKMLKEIEAAVASGKRLTQQVLGYARLGSYHVKPVDLNHLVNNLLETVGRTRRDITIQTDLEENLPEVHADEGQMIQVLLNLLINAGEAMPEGGRLEVKTAVATDADIPSTVYTPRPGRYVKVTVADTGVGMDPKTQQRIFEPFFTTKAMGHGAGLGLASVYGIVKAHSGYIEVVSAQERGSAFHVYLPVGSEAAAPGAGLAASSGQIAGTVLVVEDDPVVLTATTGMLAALGYGVKAAGSGTEALQIYSESPGSIDLVILDMVMPEMGGSETYARLRAIDPQVTVLLSSGYSLNTRITEILKRGCNGFIQKPFTLEVMSETLKELFQAKRSRDAAPGPGVGLKGPADEAAGHRGITRPPTSSGGPDHAD
jgi:signal transduction histidine kinase/CheY-like chemotaxis protein